MQATIDGIRISYTDSGQGPRILLFIHGFPLCREAWAQQIPAFAPTHRVLAPDLRGLGESETTEGATDMARYADDLAALLVALKIKQATLIGHSMGGYVALAFMERHPDRVGGLVLVGTRAGADSAEAAAKRRATAVKVRTEGPAFLVEDMTPKMLAANNRDHELAQQVRALMAPSKAAGVASALEGMANRPDMTARLGQIQVPTLVITGAEDTLIPPSESELLAKHITGAELAILPSAGHLVAFEQAEAFNGRLRAWLAGMDRN